MVGGYYQERYEKDEYDPKNDHDNNKLEESVKFTDEFAAFMSHYTRNLIRWLLKCSKRPPPVNASDFIIEWEQKTNLTDVVIHPSEHTSFFISFFVFIAVSFTIFYILLQIVSGLNWFMRKRTMVPSDNPLLLPTVPSNQIGFKGRQSTIVKKMNQPVHVHLVTAHLTNHMAEQSLVDPTLNASTATTTAVQKMSKEVVEPALNCLNEGQTMTKQRMTHSMEDKAQITSDPKSDKEQSSMSDAMSPTEPRQGAGKENIQEDKKGKESIDSWSSASRISSSFFHDSSREFFSPRLKKEGIEYEYGQFTSRSEEEAYDLLFSDSTNSDERQDMRRERGRNRTEMTRAHAGKSSKETLESHIETPTMSIRQRAIVPKIGLLPLRSECATRAGCRECQMQALYSVTIRWPDIQSYDVYITGSFVNWTCKIPLRKDPVGWMVELKLPRGHHEYRFVVDGGWAVNSARPSTIILANPTDNGLFNHIVHV